MTASNNHCPICAADRLQHHQGKNRVEYKGKQHEIDVQYSICAECGSEQANAGQLRANKRTMRGFRKRVHGLVAEDGTES